MVTSLPVRGSRNVSVMLTSAVRKQPPQPTLSVPHLVPRGCGSDHSRMFLLSRANLPLATALAGRLWREPVAHVGEQNTRRHGSCSP